MKPALLTLSLLLLAIIGNPSLSKAELVVDLNGNPVVSGSQYYILPYTLGQGGGLDLAPIDDPECPLDVIQIPKDCDYGEALVLESPSETVVQISTDTLLNVSFAKTPDCAPKSSKWILPLDAINSSVRIGTVLPQDSFQVKKYNASEPISVYEFVHNTLVYGMPYTTDIGIKTYNQGKRLAAINSTDGSPFRFVFKSVTEEAKIRMKTA